MAEQASLPIPAQYRPVPVVIDAMIRLPPGLPDEVYKQVRRRSTFDNPLYFKLRNMGRYVGNVPRHIDLSWEDRETGEYVVPRGLTVAVREALAGQGMRAQWVDRRVDAPLDREFHFSNQWEDREYQRRIVDLAVKYQNTLFESPAGCLGADTIIELNRAGKSFKMRIAEVVRAFNSARHGSRAFWDASIPTRLRVRDAEGYIRLHRLRAAYESGVRPTFVLSAGGRTIVATADHRFLTSVGWRRVSELSVGDSIEVDGGPPTRVTARTALVRVDSIVPGPDQPTYDLEMDGDPENFLANGFVVHNSGKTSMGLLLLATTRQRTIVILGRRQLARQWVEDCERFLGFTPRVLGMGARRTSPTSSPLTIASQMALYRRPREEGPHYGQLILDEAQHGSARTYREVMQYFPARIRTALSDDPTRHDKAEGMTHAHFGEVRDRVTIEELRDAGKVIPVVLRVVPTDWVPRDKDGVPLPPGALEWPALIRRQMADETRNDLVARWVIGTCGEANAGLVLGYRVRHAEWFYQALNREGLKCGLLLGGPQRRGIFDRTVRGLRDGSLRVAAATIGSVGEGFNVQRLDRGYLASAGSQNTQALKQMAGRFMRPFGDKSEDNPPEVYFFLDGLRDPHPGLGEDENKRHRQWTGAQFKGLQNLVRKNRARFVRAEVLARDGVTWHPLLRGEE